MAEIVDHPRASERDHLPHNYEAEQALLGAILLNNDAYHRVCETVRAEHFYDPVHGRIYRACAALIDRGRSADPPQLVHIFENDASLQGAGGPKYLARLASTAVTVISAPDYAKTVAELYQRRALIQTCEAVAEEARGIERTNEELFDYLDGEVYPMTAQRGAPEPADMAATLAGAVNLAEEAYRRDGGISGITSGLGDLDHLLSGFQPGELIVIAGRPSMGKTDTLVNVIASAAAAMGPTERALFFSLEMPREMIGQRLLARQTGISAHRQRGGDLDANDFDRLIAAQQRLQGLPITIDDYGSSTIARMRGIAKRQERQGFKVKMIGIDYLQRMPWPANRRDENTALSEITRGAKDLSMEFRCPVVLLSQLSRAVENREIKRPIMSDLRGSGSIEQDADVVIFCYRNEYYAEEEPMEGTPEWDAWHRENDKDRGIMELIVAKQRCGPLGAIRVAYSGERSSLTNLVRRSVQDSLEGI